MIFYFHEIILLMLGHWMADFICQTDWQAKNKSSNMLALTKHVLVYSLIMGVWVIVLLSVSLPSAIIFFGITFGCHFWTDFFTSKLNSYLWKKGDTHNFFVSIGFDQWLHLVQILGTYYLITDL